MLSLNPGTRIYKILKTYFDVYKNLCGAMGVFIVRTQLFMKTFIKTMWFSDSENIWWLIS